MTDDLNLLGEVPFWARTADGGVLFEDIPVRPGGRLPSFFIIGAPKAATTSLQAYLGQHPQIFMCEPKEPHFFSTDQIYARGLDWYRGLFADASPDQICGEASTSYTRYPSTPDVPARIHQVVPEAKLIYLLRDPIERAVSACMFAFKRERALEERVFEPSVDAILEKADLILTTSDYMKQLEQYLRFFPREQIAIELQEDLANDTEGTVQRLLRFLEVDTDTTDIDTDEHHNRSSSIVEGLKEEEAGRLASKIPGYSVLKKLIPDVLVQKIKEMVIDRMDTEDVVEPMSEEMRAKLRARYAPQIDTLSEFIGRDLSHWGA